MLRISPPFRLVNEVDQDGVTPVMVAIQKESTYMIQLLVGKGARMDLLDKKKNTVFHYAATTSKNTIQVRSTTSLLHAINTRARLRMHYICSSLFLQLICPENSTANHPAVATLNTCNEEGDTPLHVACKNDKPDCVQALMCAGNTSIT